MIIISTMRYNRIIALIFVAMMSLSAMGQERIDRSRLDTLMGKGQYATAYTLAQEQYRQAQSAGGAEQLASAFYLTALDYVYNKAGADSALVRYGQLARRLQGVDRAVAYAFLFQTYNACYSRFEYEYRYNKPSDDPNLKYPRWHQKRMEDTLMACADSVLAYAGLLRQASPQPYNWMWVDSRQAPVMDSSLLGMLIQALFTDRPSYSAKNSVLNDSLRSLLQLPLPDFCRKMEGVSQLPYPLNLYLRVSKLYTNGTADMMLWLDLQRLDACYYVPEYAYATDSLSRYYSPHLQSDEMRAMLALHRAKCLNYEQRKVEAEQICLATEQAWPGTHGALGCRELRDLICRPDYEVHYNVVESSRRSRMACVESKNLRQLNFRLVNCEMVPDSLLWYYRKLDTLLRLPAVKEWQQELPDPGDHLTHQYIIELPPVPQGDYYLVASTDSSMCYDEFQSVDAAFINYYSDAAAGKHTKLSPSSGYLIDRLTGQPMVGKRVTLHLEGVMTSHEYRRHCRTDKEGYFHFPTSSVRYNFMEAEDITAQLDEYEYSISRRSWNYVETENTYGQRKTNKLDIVMTDRPVYRLGDTVRFSCVAYRRKESGKEWKLNLRLASKVDLVATFGVAYGDSQDTLHLTTDKHGRCWGEFVIPADGRNGRYRLEVKSPDYSYRSYCDVKVEAYKPPHFMVSLSTTADDAVDDTGSVRRFGQPITVYGTAMSYSGAPMTGAKVKWEVSRERMQDPMQSFSDANEYPYHDSLTVDNDGLFQFTFTPEPDSGTVIYTAYVRVTDADGELHEQRLSFHVSDADGYCMLTSDGLSHFSFVYNNFDHQPLKGAVHVELYQLQQPDTIRTLDPIMYEHPEAQWVGTRDEFRQKFPYRAFSREEGDKQSWPVVAKRYEQTTEGRQLEIDGLPSGMYRVVFSSPDGGRHETLVNHVASGGRVTGDAVVWLRTTPKREFYHSSLICQVGDTVRIEMGSPYGNQPLYYCVSHAAKIYQRGMMVLDSSRTSMLTIPVTKKMKDGFVVTLSAMREGCSFSDQYIVNVVRPERLLKIGTETFRDRLQPGEQEQWRLRITSADTLTGQPAKGVEANLSLAMYDLSLEQYNRHDYGFWPWYQRYSELHTKEAGPMSETIRGVWSSRGASFNNQTNPPLGFTLPVISDYCKQLVLRFNPGVVRGTICDAKTMEPLPFVNVVLKKDGKQVAKGVTDFDGYYSIKAIPEGEYDIEVSSVGYNSLQKRIYVDCNGMSVYNIWLSSGATTLDCVEIVSEKVPMIEIGTAESGMRMSADDIQRMPGNSVESIVAAVGGMGYSDGGTARGESGMVTMQGGVRKRTGINVPKSAVAVISPMLQFGNSVDDETLVNLRSNMSTLALFEPALRSDKEGYVEVSFVMPDVLTQWRVHGAAWTDRFQMGHFDRTVQTQKELMVQPLLPRFLRQGDTTEIRAKVSNLSDSAMEIVVKLNVEGEMRSEVLTVPAQSSGIAAFRLSVGKDWHVANYKIVASAHHVQGHHSDGEQGQLPVLANRERVTVSRLLYIAGTTDSTQGKSARFQFPMRNTPFDSVSLVFHANPMDYAVQALPHFKRHRMPGNLYLANSIYVNHLTSQISPLSEKERKRMASSVRSDLKDLLKAQTSQGGWSWMPGGKAPSLHITESILQRLRTCPSLFSENYYDSYYWKALSYLDKTLVRDYEALEEAPQNAYLHLSTLYTRSFYFDTKPLEKCDSTTRKAYDYYYRLCRKQYATLRFPQASLHSQGQMALLMLHMGDTAEAVELAKRIKESAHVDDSLGMYWVSNVSGYGWYERPIETAALMVDVFADVLHDWESVNRIQQWILSSKQGTTWKTDMATAHAVAALVRQPSDSARMGQAILTVNGQPVDEVYTHLNDTETLDIKLSNTSPYPAWGAVFLSRELPVDSIQYNGTGISLRKTLSRVDADGSLHLLAPEATLHVGDRIRVHIDVYCHRDMDNMVLSDQRAAAFEPVSTASGWCWNDGLHYYTDVRDDRLDCYIDRLNEGHYYVEYDLWVRHAGTFANGIGILRSVYAPEFRANTPSTKIRIED